MKKKQTTNPPLQQQQQQQIKQNGGLEFVHLSWSLVMLIIYLNTDFTPYLHSTPSMMCA